MKRGIMDADLSLSLLFADTVNASLQPAVPELLSLYDAGVHIKLENISVVSLAVSMTDRAMLRASEWLERCARAERVAITFIFGFPSLYVFLCLFVSSRLHPWSGILRSGGSRFPWHFFVTFGCSFACFPLLCVSFSAFFSCSLCFPILDRRGNIVGHERRGGSCVVALPTRSVSRRLRYVSEDVPLISLIFHSRFCFGRRKNGLRITCSTSVFPLSPSVSPLGVVWGRGGSQ